MAQPENLLTAAIVRRLKVRGAWSYKVHADGYSPSGVPDLLVCYRGRFVALEVKIPPNTLTKIQEHTIKQIALAGGFAAEARTVEEVGHILDIIDSDIDSLDNHSSGSSGNTGE